MEYRRKYGNGGSVDRLRMAFGGKMRYAQNGTEIEGDPKKKPGSPYETAQTTITPNYRDNEGMMQAQSKGKIDAYNFSLPESGRLDDMDDDTKQMLRNTDFGKEYLSGEGSLDEQYNRYAARVVNHMRNNPEQALNAINQMIESGNENFQGLANMSDEDKLATAARYMTDRKVGDFHGALSFAEAAMPTARFYDPTDDVQAAGFKGYKGAKVLSGVGDRTVRPGDISTMAKMAEEKGIDLSEDTEESRNFVTQFMDERGSQERGPQYADEGSFSSKGTFEGADNQYFIDKAEAAAREYLRSRESQQRARQSVPQYDSRGRLIQNEMKNGGMVYMRRGGEVDGGPVRAEVSDEMREKAERTVDTSSPFRVRHRGYDSEGNKSYDVSYSPLRNALMRRNQRVKASF